MSTPGPVLNSTWRGSFCRGRWISPCCGAGWRSPAFIWWGTANTCCCSCCRPCWRCCSAWCSAPWGALRGAPDAKLSRRRSGSGPGGPQRQPPADPRHAGARGQHRRTARARPGFQLLLDELEAWQAHQRRENASLLHQATHDALTGLPNRALFEARLDQAVTTYRLHDERFALLYLDCDRFKQINDTLGHAAGDDVLIALARRIQHQLR